MIVVRMWEGLGNQLFQYAYARNLQERTTNQVLLEGERIYRECLQGEDLKVERPCEISKFHITLPFVNSVHMKKWSYLQGKTGIDRYRMKTNVGRYRFVNEGENMFGYNDASYNFFNYYIMGHFQNVRYLDAIRPILLQEISLRKEMKIPEWLINLLREREVVSVHIRRGDYLKHEYLLRTVRKINARDYYGKAMTFIAEKTENPVMLFFSDDMEWVKNNIICEQEHYFADELHLESCEELMLMSRCSHNIMGNSTFSFWGAWLNQNARKVVIGPREMSRSIVEDGWLLM